jgi:hypothetical protein
MIFVCILLGLLLASTSTLLYFSIKKNLEFLQQQEDVLTTLEQALLELDVCAKKIDKKTKLELFSDDPTVKDLVNDMKDARHAVVSIIENLTGEKDAIETMQKTEGENIA